MIVVTVLLAVALPATVWLFLRHIESINSTNEARVSELLTRIQHPEIVRPDIARKPVESQAPTFNDDLHLVGTVSYGGNGEAEPNG